MWPKRLILFPALALLFFLGLYSWNQKTGILDELADNTGLEAIGVVLRSTDYVRNGFSEIWFKYLDLVRVREENDQLRRQLTNMQNRLILAAEERAELRRLRALLSLEPPEPWATLAARVIGARMGANAVMNTITIARGYMTGARPDTPVVTEGGLVGRVLRAGPTTGTVLLIADSGSRVAVIGQLSRTQGVLVGRGPGKALELMYTPPNSELRVDEVLVTSGLDELFPKGVPVALISRVAPAEVSPFPHIEALALVDPVRLEEVLLLERPVMLQDGPSLLSSPDPTVPASGSSAGASAGPSPVPSSGVPAGTSSGSLAGPNPRVRSSVAAPGLPPAVVSPLAPSGTTPQVPQR